MSEDINWKQLTLDTSAAVKVLAEKVTSLAETIERDHNNIYGMIRDQNEKYHQLRLDTTVENKNQQLIVGVQEAKTKPAIKIVLGAAGAILLAFINALILLVFTKSGII